ncbi:MAG: hypothetical protein K2N29_06840, partial [Ruminiclostridium sp.]|nr:hypothetical protein [Ruminiclostridium sp.]
MEKKTLALLCAFSLLLGMSGCGEQQNEPPAPETSGNPSESTEPAAQTDTQTSAPAQNKNENEVVVCYTGGQSETLVLDVPEQNDPGVLVSPPGEPTVFPLLYLNIDETVTPDTKRIDVTAQCGTDEPVEAGLSAILEKYENGEWRTVPQKAGTETDDGVVKITPESPYVFSIFPENYAEPLELLGEYRISVVLGDSTETICFTVIAETPPLSANDIEMTIEEGDNVPPGTESLTLRYRYVGDAIYAEYGFGCEYTLEKKEEDGSWRAIPFSENAAFNSLGYLIGTESPNQATSVSLRDDFYAEPLTPGEYRVVKPIGNLTLTAEFRILARCGNVEYEIESVAGELTLQIEEIRSDGFWCTHPWPYPAHYLVKCDPTEYADYCVGDNIEVEYAPMYKTSEWEYRLLPTAIRLSDYHLETGLDAKPVIYLYPEEKTEVEVRLDYRGQLTVTYPEYRDGWRVTAKPDGTLTDADGNEYSYLFWEGISDTAYGFREGFCVQGCDTAEFLREKLSLLGLTPREYNELIVYWLPKMQDNPYNVISFQGEAYTDSAALSVSPAPDTVLRVFMAYYPSETPVTIPEQNLTPTERKGFTLV